MPSSPTAVAAVFVRSVQHQHGPTVRSLLLAGIERVIVGAADEAEVSALALDDRVEVVTAIEPAAFVNAVSARFRCTVFACDAPVVVAPGAFEPTLGLVADDLRVSTVSYWCNFAGYLSFPTHNTPASHQQGDLDERSGTTRLRSRAPSTGPVSIPVARGPLVAITRPALTACGDLRPTPFDDLSMSVAEFGLRAAARGFTALLDPTTYVVRPFDLAAPQPSPLDEDRGRAWLHERHPTFPALYDRLLADPESPVARAHGLARAQATGLRILIDGSVLGPLETGTQVQLMHVVSALARREDVREIVVSVPGAVPGYAADAFSSPKVRPVIAPNGEFPPDLRYDVVHRPFQPDRPLPFDHWRSVARRVVITVQDVIAYRNGSYHSDPQQWLAYRHGFESATAAADAIAVITDDVLASMVLERVPVEPGRVHRAPNGTDHLSGRERTTAPAPFLDPARAGVRFLLVLGTTYLHKNRDLAIRASLEVRRRGHDHLLVVVGAEVPYGSSRHLEAEALGVDDDGVLNILDVSSEERNWLLRHADVVVYSSSAEGFGLIPFEAAAFGTPTVSVRFGPLAEVQPGIAGAAASWDPADLADAIVELIADPDSAAAAIAETRAAGTEYTWDRTAEMLVAVYRSALASPASPRPASIRGV